MVDGGVCLCLSRLHFEGSQVETHFVCFGCSNENETKSPEDSLEGEFSEEGREATHSVCRGGRGVSTSSARSVAWRVFQNRLEVFVTRPATFRSA